jgi:hypothetical protein
MTPAETHLVDAYRGVFAGGEASRTVLADLLARYGFDAHGIALPDADGGDVHRAARRQAKQEVVAHILRMSGYSIFGTR